MRLPLFIARRYLFSPKKRGAINLISLVSAAGMAIGTAALVIILSVFNGIDLLLGEATSSFTPDLTLSPARGKLAPLDTALLGRLDGDDAILHYRVVVEEIALAKSGERMMPVTVKGVTPDYDQRVNLSGTIIIGRFALEEGGRPAAILGAGVASALRARLGTAQPVTLYYPGRDATPSSLAALNSERVYPSAIFSAQQELDDKYVITGIDLARRLFDAGGRFSKIEIALRDPARAASVKARLAAVTACKVEDREDLNGAFYAMMRSEKLVISLLLLFILGIASFNIIASISMLIIDKREDIAVYRALGMSGGRLLSTFRAGGMLIVAAGMAAGLVVGIALCLLQQHLGLVSLGEGSYLVKAYPVKIAWDDVAWITLAVAAIGGVASHFPARYLIHEFTKT
ncbi:MAG: ABC transporter permease [Odoribacteraceae bacterium]|jgi:lipoprotein-releasing system permease protein|nr:ABC transporter permease [Odoribacteraceae bacterium]